MRTDWTPLLTEPGADLPDGLTQILSRRDLGHARGFDARNGQPALLPYRWRPGEAERDAELAARLDAIRAEAERRAALAPEWEAAQ